MLSSYLAVSAPRKIFPTSPLKAIRAKAPNAKVEFDAGTNVESAAALAKSADIAIVFASRWETEGADASSLSLPDNQDDLIATEVVDKAKLGFLIPEIGVYEDLIKPR